MRRVLADRWSAGMLAVLTASFVLVQVLMPAWALAAAVRLGDETRLEICHGAGMSTVETPAQDGSPSTQQQGCPCGILCGAGAAFAVVPPVLDLGAAYTLRDGIDLRFSGDPAADLAPRAAGAPPFPTGPPALSA